jgi:hypothetical protein
LVQEGVGEIAPLAPGGAANHTAPPMSNDAVKVLAIVAAIVAVLLISNFMVDFYDWNKMQNCATSNGRNCGIYRH